MEKQENVEINLETCCLMHCPQLKIDIIFGTKGSTLFDSTEEKKNLSLKPEELKIIQECGNIRNKATKKPTTLL